MRHNPPGHPASVRQSSENKPATQPNTDLNTRRDWASVNTPSNSTMNSFLNKSARPSQMNILVTEALRTKWLTQTTQPAPRIQDLTAAFLPRQLPLSLSRRSPPGIASLEVVDHVWGPLQMLCLVGVAVRDSTRQLVGGPRGVLDELAQASKAII